jgi:hypothetical protein
MEVVASTGDPGALLACLAVRREPVDRERIHGHWPKQRAAKAAAMATRRQPSMRPRRMGHGIKRLEPTRVEIIGRQRPQRSRMNLQRGLSRLWLVGSSLWLVTDLSPIACVHAQDRGCSSWSEAWMTEDDDAPNRDHEGNRDDPLLRA